MVPVARVVGNIHVLTDEFVNVYLVIRGDHVVLVDAGIESTGAKILDYVKELGHSPTNISLVVVTHHHWDHTGSLKFIVEKTGAEVVAHKNEAPLIESRTGLTPSKLLEDGDVIEGLTVIHTPGHTPGHICLLDKETSSLFIGDLVHMEDNELKEIPHEYSQDPKGNRESIKKLKNTEFKHLLLSHGKPIINNGKEKLLELIQKLTT